MGAGDKVKAKSITLSCAKGNISSDWQNFERAFQPIIKPDDYGLRRTKQELRVPVLSALHETLIHRNPDLLQEE